MKKLSLLLMMLAFAIVTQAGEPLKAASKNLGKNIPGLRFDNKKLDMPTNVALQGRHKASITEQPEGEVEYYVRSTNGGALSSDGGNIYYGDQSGFVEVVRAADDDDKVYIKNILFGSGSYFGDSWVEGSLSEDGTKLTVPMGQSIYWSDSYQADVLLCWGSTTVEDNNLVLTVDETIQEITYTVDPEAKTITLDNTVAPSEDNENEYWQFCATGPSCVWTDDGAFGGFLEWNTVWTLQEDFVVPELITEQPAGELVTYIREGGTVDRYGEAGTQSGTVNIVYATNSDVYIQNLLYARANNVWVKGTYYADDGIISIPVGQFISWNDGYGYGIQLMWGSTIEGEEGLIHEIDESVENIFFKVDGDVITLLDSEGEALDGVGILGVWNDDLTFAGFDYGTILRIPTPAVPANPTADKWYDKGDESGYSKLYFTLPTTDVDGNKIEEMLLSLSIFTDNDQLFTFDAETYSHDLTDDLTEIPYEILSGGYDFGTGIVYFYRTNAEGYETFFTERIGIQVHYTAGGVKNSSDIVYLYPFGPPTAIDQAVSEVETNGEYYNVMGQKQDKRNLPAGIYIHNGKKVIVK